VEQARDCEFSLRQRYSEVTQPKFECLEIPHKKHEIVLNGGDSLAPQKGETVPGAGYFGSYQVPGAEFGLRWPVQRDTAFPLWALGNRTVTGHLKASSPLRFAGAVQKWWKFSRCDQLCRVQRRNRQTGGVQLAPPVPPAGTRAVSSQRDERYRYQQRRLLGPPELNLLCGTSELT